MPTDVEILTDEAKRLNKALGPVMAGFIIDVVDFATFGPIGLVLGLPVGGLAGYWLGKTMGLKKQACLLCALAAGVYCTIPFTELLPLGTMVGAYARYRQSDPKEPTTQQPELAGDKGRLTRQRDDTG